ncbi:LysR family transcriptional regulator [Aliiroseovarius subalbicans]|uniref:LysR family transcriptional regulator n=1 Tax=Aliiroseovarius subalbicans TaxID=2925840 RepID=UPI001F5662C9|nr:LysR family transcriptional regulator [Aliiroseovarius subalbicans]MCI2398816.1 LysR family transcriptional regulator [Aliiroseovarius subalbicans]
MDLDWNDLRIFLAVARAESLSGAGKVLKRDAATVGRRVARLEAGLGAPLFTKSPQGYALTDAGARLMAHAEQAEQAVLSGTEALAGQAGQLSGQVRIGAPDGCANFLLPQVCAAIAARHPDLELQIVALPRVINLSKREADLAIAVSPPEAGRLTVQKITDYRLHLAASADYLAQHPLTRLEDLNTHPVVGYIPDMIFDKELDYLSETGAERVTLASNSVSVQLWLLRHGGGVGIAHDFAIPFAPGLRKVLEEAVSLTRSFYLIRHAGDARVERLARVAEELAVGIRQEVARLESMA